MNLILLFILFRRTWKPFNYNSCCRCHISGRSYHNSILHGGSSGLPSKTTQIEGVQCVSCNGLGACGLLESLLQALSFIEGRTTLILMSSEVQELSFQIKLCLRVKRFVVTDNLYVSIDDKYISKHFQFMQDVFDEFSSATSPGK